MLKLLPLITDFVRFPSVSASEDAIHRQGIDDAGNFLKDILTSLSFSTRIIPTERHPIVFAERKTHPSHPKILFYGHYDVQPSTPLELWETPPFEATVRGNRIYGRGTSDNKGPICAILAALSAVLEKNPKIPLNISCIFEGEEEIGSPNFENFLKTHPIDTDIVIVSDTGSHSEDHINITTGLRGITGVEVHIMGPNSDVHSGTYGGAILNPIQALTELCASLHTRDGLVDIPDFYADVHPPEAWELEQIAQIAAQESILTHVNAAEYCPPNHSPMTATRFLPTLEFNGIWGGYQGHGSKTIIPSEAFAKITCRLVHNQDPLKIQQLLVQTLTERCPKQVSLSLKPISGNCHPYLLLPPHKSRQKHDSFLKKAFLTAEIAIQNVFGHKPTFLREGGSIGTISAFKTISNADSLLIGLATNQNNAHAPNENASLVMLARGQIMYEELLGKLSVN